MISTTGRNTITSAVNIWGSGPVLSTLRVSGDTIINTLQTLGAAIFNSLVTFFGAVLFKTDVSFTVLPTSSQATPTQSNQLVTKNYVDSTIISGELNIFDNANVWTNTNQWTDNSYFDGNVKWTKSCIFDLDADEVLQVGSEVRPVANFLATTTTFTIGATGAASIGANALVMNGVGIVDIAGGGYTFPYPVFPVGGFLKIQPLGTTLKALRSLYLESTWSYFTSDLQLQITAPEVSIGSTTSTVSLIGKAIYIGGGAIGTYISSSSEAEISGAQVQLKTTNGNKITMSVGKIEVDANNTEIDMKALKIEQIALNHQRSNNVVGTAEISDIGNKITLRTQQGTSGPGILGLYSTNSIYLGNNFGDLTDSIDCKAAFVRTSAGTKIIDNAPAISMTASGTVDVNGLDVDINGASVSLKNGGVDKLKIVGGSGNFTGLDFTFNVFGVDPIP